MKDYLKQQYIITVEEDLEIACLIPEIALLVSTSIEDDKNPTLRITKHGNQDQTQSLPRQFSECTFLFMKLMIIDEDQIYQLFFSGKDKDSMAGLYVLSIPKDNIAKSVMTLLSNITKDKIKLFYSYCQIRNEILVRREFGATIQLLQLKRIGTQFALKHTIELRNDFSEIQFVLELQNRCIFTSSGIYSLEILETAGRPKEGIIKNIRPLDLKPAHVWINPEYTSLNPFCIKDSHTAILADYNNQQYLLTNREGSDIRARLMNFPLFLSFQMELDKSKSLHKLSEDGMFFDKFNLFGNSRYTVPHYLMFRKSMFSSYDLKTQQISYYRRMEKVDEERLTYLELRVYKSDILDQSDTDSSTINDLHFIQNNPVSLLMSYNILNRTTFLYQLVKAKKSNVINHLLSALELLPANQLPFLFPEIYLNGQLGTAFDCAFDLE